MDCNPEGISDRFLVAAHANKNKLAMTSHVAKSEFVIENPAMLPIFSAASDILGMI